MRFPFKMSVTALAVAVSAGLAPIEANAEVIYNDLYKHFNSASSLEKNGQAASDDIASWAHFANQAEAFGGVIGFDQPTNKLKYFSVVMSNWNGWDPEGGLGQATPGYTTDLTLELYNVDRSGALTGPGALITEDTENHDIAGRQIPDEDNKTFADGGGTDSLVQWELGGVDVGEEVLFMVRVDGLVGKGFGNPPANEALKSLNIASAVTGTAPDVTAGIDTDPGVYWRSDANTSGQISRFEAGQVLARAQSVPVPASIGLLGIGLLGVGLAARGTAVHRRARRNGTADM